MVQIKDLLTYGIESDELSYYLEEFPKNSPNFALIKVGGDCFVKPEQLYESLAILSQLSLYPIVIHGGGKQLDEAYKKVGKEPEKINGKRVTTQEDLESIIIPTLQQINDSFVAGIEAHGGSAYGLTDEEVIFAKKVCESTELGYVGDVIDIDQIPIEGAIVNGKMPIIWCLGYDSGQILNINADNVAMALAKKIPFSKFIMLSSVGGVLDENGEVIPEINYAQLGDTNVTGGMKLKLESIADFFDEVKYAIDVQITSPENLLAELFTHKGKGTLIRNKTSVEDQYPPPGFLDATGAVL